MDASAPGELDVLVATTVIEVGVDVPNATVMVILDADRFGIAQLHQLRGRVGRGEHRVARAGSSRSSPSRRPPSPRVEALVASTDGFELAEVDLELRGEGTLMSTAQKGRSDLKLASLRRDRELVAARPRRGVRDRRRRPDPRRPPDARRRARPAVHRRRRSLPHQVLSRPRSVCFRWLEGRGWSQTGRRRFRRRGRRGARGGRCPSGRGSPRSGRRRCRPAPRRRPRVGWVRQEARARRNRRT